MSMATVTAKITCTAKNTSNYANSETTHVTFGPDYTDGRNKAWAAATPSLNLTMTLNGQAAQHFHQGQAYTLTFTPDDDTPPADG